MGITVEDLKNQYSMADIVSRYGLQPNRAGFISCPFHQEDRTPSLKLYKTSFYCYGCGIHGDIFTFVMLMDGCDFKTAFRRLGGEYSGKGPSDAAIIRMKKMQLERQKQERIIQQANDRYMNSRAEMYKLKESIETMKPMSDEWCVSKNRLTILEAEADQALNDLLDLQKQERR